MTIMQSLEDVSIGILILSGLQQGEFSALSLHVCKSIYRITEVQHQSERDEKEGRQKEGAEEVPDGMAAWFRCLASWRG